MSYAVKTWDGTSQVFPCFRKAKAAWRVAMKETYTAWIKPHRGRAGNYEITNP